MLFLIEFFADKVPGFDLAWNALHTFVRVPAAALIAYGAAAHLSPTPQVLCAALGGLVALAAHGGKTTVRAAVAASPEPFSNVALSSGEDVLAVSLIWFAAQHPVVAAVVAAAFLAVIMLTVRLVFRAFERLFRNRGAGASANMSGCEVSL
jgi:hypothetical protein